MPSLRPNENRIATGKWWDRPWSLVDGCTPVSPGCANCWSAGIARRFRRRAIQRGKHPFLNDDTGHWNGHVKFRADRLDLPLRTKQSTVWTIWNDLFHEGVTDEQRDKAFGTMALSPQHLFLVLTKRADVMEGYSMYQPWADIRQGIWPLRNVWLGVTVENQHWADKRIPHLLRTPAARRFVSYEPALGPVDFSPYLGTQHEDMTGVQADDESIPDDLGLPFHNPWVHGLDLVIAGCESGSGRRHAEADWFRRVRDDCEAAKVSYFLKQMEIGGKVVHAPQLDGQQYLEWPE